MILKKEEIYVAKEPFVLRLDCVGFPIIFHFKTSDTFKVLYPKNKKRKRRIVFQGITALVPKCDFADILETIKTISYLITKEELAIKNIIE